jgi:hypothetical protein
MSGTNISVHFPTKDPNDGKFTVNGVEMKYVENVLVFADPESLKVKLSIFPGEIKIENANGEIFTKIGDVKYKLVEVK